MENLVTLYIATHKTGLKYFGKTIKYNTVEDLQKYYHGSGADWTKYLKEFGDDVTMEIYGIYHIDDVVNKALTFSLINDIVNSEEWANMILEDGLDAGGTTGYKHTEETKRKIGEANKGNKVEHSEASKKKMSNSHKGLKAKHKPRTKKNKPENMIICPHCNKSGSQGNMKRYHFNNCKSNPINLDKPEVQERTNNNKGKKFKHRKESEEVTCTYCSESGKGNIMKRWHFDNCKYKI